MKKNPLYFYHLVSKDANIEEGLISLQYMYEHGMYELFDKNAKKYTHRCVDEWDIAKFKDRKEESLSREEILEALSLFRGPHGSKYIYFFRYPPFKALGNRMASILEVKDIYRIDLNDEELQGQIEDIFYGFDMSCSDSQKLDRKYYENVTEEEYFSKYDDGIPMNFSTLNHIAIAFKDGYCKKELITKVDVK